MKKRFKNTRLKILALVSAIILWLFVVGIENNVYLFPEELNIELRNLEEAVGLSQTLPSVKLYLKADKDIIENLTKSDFEVFADLKNLEIGDHNVPVSASSNNPQVSILRVEPSEISIKLQPLAEKEVNVLASYSGQPAEGYKVSELNTDVENVTIAGTQSIIDKIDEIEAKLVLDGTETSDINQKVTLVVPGSLNIPKGMVNAIPLQIVVTAKIESSLNEKTVEIRPKISGTDDPDSWINKIKLEPQQTTITGELEYLDTIDYLETEKIDVSKLQAGESIEINLVVPENIELKNQNLKVTASNNSVQEEEKTVQAPITFIGQNPDVKVKKVEPTLVNVTVKGPKQLIDGLKPGDVTIEIDLADIEEEGLYTIDTDEIKIPEGVTATEYDPTEVQIEIS